MRFGIHNPSWVYGSNPTEAFEGIKAKVAMGREQWLRLVLGDGPPNSDGGVGAPTEQFMEGWTALSALAAVTSRIRLATLATSVAYRNPAHLAKIAAGVDQISGGRMTLGIGAGWFEGEYRNL
jgi:alkanesulfonate monooxygenase SsuD/methylene tetrahydromethanopterin reductase-like flavin-dependent oxidoreductase (luciferase family)